MTDVDWRPILGIFRGALLNRARAGEMGFPDGMFTLHCDHWKAAYGSCHGCQYSIGCILTTDLGVATHSLKEAKRKILYYDVGKAGISSPKCLQWRAKHKSCKGCSNELPCKLLKAFYCRDGSQCSYCEVKEKCPVQGDFEELSRKFHELQNAVFRLLSAGCQAALNIGSSCFVRNLEKRGCPNQTPACIKQSVLMHFFLTRFGMHGTPDKELEAFVESLLAAETTEEVQKLYYQIQS